MSFRKNNKEIYTKKKIKIKFKVKYFYTFFCFIITFLSFNLKSQTDTVKIGAFITSLHDFNLTDNTFVAEMHVWCLYKNKEFDFEKEIDIKNNNEISFSGTSLEKINDQNWFYTKALVVIRKKWETQNYPFDKQNLSLTIESSEYDKNELLFIPDTQNTKLSKDLKQNLNEWNIYETIVNADSTIYESNFGNTNYSNQSIYSKFNLTIKLERNSSISILFKLITGLLVAFIIALCVFFIKPINTDPRFGLCVGSLFAAVGNKYIVEGVIPPTANLSMLDQLHNLTFIFIIIIIISSIISLWIYEKGTEKAIEFSKGLDKTLFVTLLITFTVIFCYVILTSIKVT